MSGSNEEDDSPIKRTDTRTRAPGAKRRIVESSDDDVAGRKKPAGTRSYGERKKQAKVVERSERRKRRSEVKKRMIESDEDADGVDGEDDEDDEAGESDNDSVGSDVSA